MNRRRNYNKALVCIIMGFVVLGAAVGSLSAQENKTQKALKIHGQGIELWRQGNFTDAADKLREAIKIDDTNASIYYDLGKLLMDELKDTDNAIDAFTLSASYEINHWRAYYNIGKAYAKKEDCKKAIEFYLKTMGALEKLGQLTENYKTVLLKRLKDCHYEE